MRFLPSLLFALLLLATPLAARAEPPLPYWASLRASEVNMRVGPGEDYRIMWVYRRQHLPVRVLRAMEGWRLVQDQDGARGWVLLRLLSRERSFLVTGREAAELREKSGGEGRVLLRLAPGVTGKLGDCSDGWCKAEVSGKQGYLPQGRLWGSGQ
jgi:SH3-like domain-containing protein